MLIKPWNETATPRHALEDEYESTPVIPHVEINFNTELTSVDYVLVVPDTMKVLISSIDSSVIGEIKVNYEQGKSDTKISESGTEDLYDEDEQLYRAMNQSVLFESSSIPIFITKNDSGKLILAISVPIFKSAIATNILSRHLVDALGAKTSQCWITLSPCALNNGETINKLVSGVFQVQSKNLYDIPDLKPPHSITGIAASLNSVLNLKYPTKLVSLLVNADGALGYEKADRDALVDVAHVISKLIGFKNYCPNTCKAVRKLNTLGNSGMYL